MSDDNVYGHDLLAHWSKHPSTVKANLETVGPRFLFNDLHNTGEQSATVSEAVTAILLV